MNINDEHVKQQQIKNLESSITTLKQDIVERERRIYKVYGSTKDGSLGLAIDTEIRPLKIHLKRMEEKLGGLR